MFVVHIFNKKKKEEYVSSGWMEKVALDWSFTVLAVLLYISEVLWRRWWLLKMYILQNAPKL